MAEHLSSLFTSYDVNDVKGQVAPSKTEAVAYVPSDDDKDNEDLEEQEDDSRKSERQGKAKGGKGKGGKGSRQRQRATKS